MDRFIYNTATPFGQILSGGIDKLLEGLDDLQRASSALDAMTAEEAESEMGVPAAGYIDFKNRVNAIENYLIDEQYARNLVLFDQG